MATQDLANQVTDCFIEMIEKLNALYPARSPWQWERAEVDCNDQFGSKICAGTEFLRREITVTDDVILSAGSVGRLLHLLFHANPDLDQLADKILEAEAWCSGN